MSSNGGNDGGDVAGIELGPPKGSTHEETTPIICTVCQKPIKNRERSHWRGEPVHFECGAELRCGVSIGAETTQ